MIKSLLSLTCKNTIVKPVEVANTGSVEAETALSVVLNKDMIEGPVTLKIKADSHAGRFSTQNYMFVFSFKTK